MLHHQAFDGGGIGVVDGYGAVDEKENEEDESDEDIMDL